MCLITTQKEPKIADKDITVYKYLNIRPDGELRPPIYYLFTKSFHYKLNQLYKTDIKVGSDEDWQGFGDKDVKWIDKLTKDYAKWRYHPDLINFSEGFHSCLNQEHLHNREIHSTWGLFECTIPKGSLYHENPVGLVVSNQIIINKQIKQK